MTCYVYVDLISLEILAQCLCTWSDETNQCDKVSLFKPLQASQKASLQSNTETSSQAVQKEMDIIAEIKKMLPVTRFLCLGTVGVTLVVLLGIVHPSTISFNIHLVFMRLQVCGLLIFYFSIFVRNQAVDLANINIFPPG